MPSLIPDSFLAMASVGWLRRNGALASGTQPVGSLAANEASYCEDMARLGAHEVSSFSERYPRTMDFKPMADWATLLVASCLHGGETGLQWAIDQWAHEADDERRAEFAQAIILGGRHPEAEIPPVLLGEMLGDGMHAQQALEIIIGCHFRIPAAIQERFAGPLTAHETLCKLHLMGAGLLQPSARFIAQVMREGAAEHRVAVQNLVRRWAPRMHLRNCRAALSNEAQAHPDLVRDLCLAGDPSDLPLLRHLATRAEHRAALARCLGFTGLAQVVDVCFDLIDADASLEMDARESVLLITQQWLNRSRWAEIRSTYPNDVRLLRGQPRTAQTWLDALQDVRLHQRQAMLSELPWRAGGAMQVPEGFVALQNNFLMHNQSRWVAAFADPTGLHDSLTFSIDQWVAEANGAQPQLQAS